MCGLAGYFYFNHQEESTNTIWQMVDLQNHRGPDDSTILAINTENCSLELSDDSNFKSTNPANLFFGFNRLSILDLSINGRQPMISENEDVVLMMNGEIYNAFDFKEKLKAKGYRFKSETDTEVVLNLYLEYGMDGMIQKLNGMFAIVIWDIRLKKLFLARDRFGIKPLYVLKEKGRLSFSSEMKSFSVLPGFSFELDEDKINEFLLFRNVINDTLFKNISNCTPGTYLSVSEYGEIKEHLFYTINDEGKNPILNGKAFSKLESTLQQSVTRQMISDVKLGCQLSGGVDSSLVTYFAKQSLEKGKLETISIDFTNPLFSEGKYINEVADNLELVAHKYVMNPEYYFEELDNATWHFEQPLNHPNTIGIYLLSQQAKNHVTVLLSGEGADEALAGYSRFIENVASPYFSRSFLSKLKQNSSDIVSFLRTYSDADSRLILGSSSGNPNLVTKLFPDFNFSSALDKRKDVLQGIDGDCVSRHRKYEMLTYLPDLLMRQDKMSMAHSIENRVPFLDNEMITTAFNLPREELVGKRNGKNEAKLLLKKICESKFNDTFAFRKKKGFGVPLKDFMSTTTFQSRWFSEIEPGMKERGIFSGNLVSKWISNIENATPNQLDAIWLMTGFEIWAQQYLDS